MNGVTSDEIPNAAVSTRLRPAFWAILRNAKPEPRTTMPDAGEDDRDEQRLHDRAERLR